MFRVYARLTQQQIEAVRRIAREERRHPADQVAVIVDEWLRARKAKEELRIVLKAKDEASAVLKRVSGAESLNG